MIGKMKIRVWLIILCSSLLVVGNMRGQEVSSSLLEMAVPSLQIAPDARGGGMGDMGVSTLPDVNSQYWNGI